MEFSRTAFRYTAHRERTEIYSQEGFILWAFDVQELHFHSNGRNANISVTLLEHSEDSRFLVQQFSLFSAEGKQRKKKPRKASPTPAIKYSGSRNPSGFAQSGGSLQVSPYPWDPAGSTEFPSGMKFPNHERKFVPISEQLPINPLHFHLTLYISSYPFTFLIIPLHFQLTLYISN